MNNMFRWISCDTAPLLLIKEGYLPREIEKDAQCFKELVCLGFATFKTATAVFYL